MSTDEAKPQVPQFTSYSFAIDFLPGSTSKGRAVAIQDEAGPFYRRDEVDSTLRDLTVSNAALQELVVRLTVQNEQLVEQMRFLTSNMKDKQSETLAALADLRQHIQNISIS